MSTAAHLTSTPGSLVPIRTERVHEKVARQLREAILDGSYRPGDRLPSERDLIEGLGVGRPAVRQALQVLEHQGLVKVQLGASGGAVVTHVGLGPALQSMINLFATRRITPQQFLDAKAVLEPAISAAVAVGITETDLDELTQNVGESRAAMETDRASLLPLTLDFHRIVARATRNPMLELILLAFTEVALYIPEFHGGSTSGWHGIIDDHDRLLSALRRRDTDEVHELMVDHLQVVVHAFAPGED